MREETKELQSKNIKIGTRLLSKNEVKNILPTYNEIFKQIDKIRECSNSEEINTAFGTQQTINNISIIGARGSGKSSVIEKLYFDLNKENNKEDGKIRNLILPSIVPEKMPENLNLMANFLGLLKEEVDNIAKAEKEKNKERFCYSEKSKIEKDYEELIQLFVYLQKDYQEIAIKTYSTDPNYIDVTSKIFSAESKFTQKFKNFIDELLKSEKFTKDAMIILFIDDMDLVPDRAIDITNTLLSYLSHRKILVIISVNMDSMQETLTLDFIRKENFAQVEQITVNYETALLDAKNEERNFIKNKNYLAAEYIKKIFPPSYRHYIKLWALNMKPDFICFSQEENINNKLPTFKELLNKVCENNYLLDDYFDIINTINYDVYRIFDDRSRGLNVVYSILYNFFYENGEEKENGILTYAQKKILIESIAFSNLELDKNRRLIFKEIVLLHPQIKHTFINFKYLNNIIGEKEIEKTKINDYILIFLFADFSARLLNRKEDLVNDYYLDCKAKVLYYLFKDEFSHLNNDISSIKEDLKFINLISDNITIITYFNVDILNKLILLNKIKDNSLNKKWYTIKDYLSLFNLIELLKNKDIQNYIQKEAIKGIIFILEDTLNDIYKYSYKDNLIESLNMKNYEISILFYEFFKDGKIKDLNDVLKEEEYKNILQNLKDKNENFDSIIKKGRNLIKDDIREKNEFTLEEKFIVYLYFYIKIENMPIYKEIKKVPQYLKILKNTKQELEKLEFNEEEQYNNTHLEEVKNLFL